MERGKGKKETKIESGEGNERWIEKIRKLERRSEWRKRGKKKKYYNKGVKCRKSRKRED